MLTREHPEARCPYCTTTLWYGLKEEPTGWKVQFTCFPPEGCGREFSPGRISRADVETIDESYRRAEQLGSILY